MPRRAATAAPDRLRSALTRLRSEGRGKIVLWNHPRRGPVLDLPGGERLWDVTAEEFGKLGWAWFKARPVRKAEVRP